MILIFFVSTMVLCVCGLFYQFDFNMEHSHRNAKISFYLAKFCARQDQHVRNRGFHWSKYGRIRIA